MHELGIMENVRELALEQARAHGAERIEAITLRIGSLSGVEPEVLRLAFEVVMADSIAASARLTIETVAAECFCAPCRHSFPAADGCCECPDCGAISRELLRGRELQLASMEVS
jgi:hydrogenase nickel incorporation protein HypA/HybF